jgi:hypothetical protein
MSDKSESILSDALSLPEADRFFVLDGLLESLRPPGLWDMDDPAFAEELMRRSQDQSPGVPWEEVRRRLKQRIE